MPDGIAEKRFDRCHVALCAEHEVHCLAGPIHSPVQIDPPATDLQIRFINAP
jgi:hypothetical protein